MTEHVDGHFSGAAGGRIYWQGWTGPAEPRGAVVIAHGIAEHGGRYAHVGERLAAAGFPTYAVDHHGHGRSAGTRGNFDRMAGVVADLDIALRETGERHPGLPLFLLGHSLGGLISLEYATGDQSRLAGLILSGPAVEIAVGSKLERRAAGLLSRLTPNLGVVPLDSSTVSRDPAVVSAYDSDPLNYRGRTRARSGAEILTTADGIVAKLSRLTLPLLILQGGDDRLVSPTSARIVAEHASSEDLTLNVYDGLYHEVFNEPEKDTVLDDVVAWLSRHV